MGCFLKGSRSFAVAQDDNIDAISLSGKVAVLVSCLFAFSGCVMYNDSDKYENPSEDVARLVYFNAVMPVLQFAELADFYEAYMDVRDDADASRRLAEEYFGDTPVSFYPDGAEAFYWGKISETPMDGVYFAEFAWSANSWADKYNVDSIGGRRWRIGCENNGTEDGSWKEFMTDAVVSVSDDDIRVEEITIRYVDNDDVVITVTGTSEPIAAYRMLYSHNSMPYSGIVNFVVSGGIDDSFSVRFSGDSEFVVIPVL